MSALPEPPRQLLRDTTDLLKVLDHTVSSLRDFTERLRKATEDETEETG